LRARFLWGAVIVASFAILLALDRVIGHPLFFSLVALAAIVLSIAEYGDVARRGGGRLDGGLLVFYAAALVALKVPNLVPRGALPPPGPETWIGLVLVAHLFARLVVAGEVEGALRRLGASVLGYVWIAVGLSAFLDVLERFGVGVTLAAICVAKANDIGGLLAGRLLGQRPLAPRVSPKKTWEGAAGGLLLSVLVAGAAALLLDAPALGGIRFLPFGIAVSLGAMAGDLGESLLKRDAGVKDSASWIPGFGGVLDMTDSLTVAGPVALASLEGLSRL